MAIPESTIVPDRVKRRLRRRLGGRIAIAAVSVTLLALITAAVIQAARPRWRTYYSPVEEQSGLKIAVEMPENWVSVPDDLVNRLAFREKQLTGISRWIYEYLLHSKPDSWKDDEIHWILTDRTGQMQDIATLEHVFSHPGIRLRRARYPLGPGLEAHILNGSGIIHAIVLFPDDTPMHRKTVILVFFSAYGTGIDHFNHIRSVFDEAVRRVRIIDLQRRGTERSRK